MTQLRKADALQTCYVMSCNVTLHLIIRHYQEFKFAISRCFVTSQDSFTCLHALKALDTAAPVSTEASCVLACSDKQGSSEHYLKTSRMIRRLSPLLEVLALCAYSTTSDGYAPAWPIWRRNTIVSVQSNYMQTSVFTAHSKAVGT
jgi:hypothetical protein